MDLTIRQDGDSILLSFPYDEDTVALVKRIPGRKWDADQRVWRCPDCLPVRSAIKHYLGIAFPPPDPPQALGEGIEYSSPIPPYKHQQVITRSLIGGIRRGRGFGVFAETGTGKTKAVLDAVAALPGSTCLVVAPAPLLSVWRSEADKHGIPAAIVHGPSRDVRSAWPPGLYVTSYQTLVNDIDAYTTKWFDAAFFDESQLLKTPSALRTRAAKAIQAGARYVMTGTPYGGSYIDIWSQMQIVDPHILGPRRVFDDTFVVYGGWESKEIVGYRNLPLLMAILSRTCVVMAKSECLDLPPKSYQTIHLELTKQQRIAYRRAMQGAIGDTPLSTPLAQIGALRQISSGFAYTDSGEVYQYGTQKTEYLRSIQWYEPTIIWYTYRMEREMIAVVLRELGVSYVLADGQHPADQAVASFEAGHATVLLAQLQSVQYGFTCNRARRVIYYSPTYSSLQRQQSEDRCHRIGQTHSVHYITLISSDIEQRIQEACDAKVDTSDYVIRKLFQENA